ncbi:ABC transporter substrate-binding protein [Streptomyces sp. NPDC056835]|uniref:caspase, EACC1-associated type n=1 Tax=Streptomyces sp. NPDC056835 TaxID=3345956 RepID=UPI0036A7BE56
MGTVLPDPAASQALLIGVHTYDRLEDLPAVRENLAGLAKAFTDPDLWGLSPSHCTPLLQPRSAQEILDTLTDVAMRATDTLVVYYAGHGLSDPHSDELHLTLTGSDKERLYTTLPYEWLRRAVLDPRVKARRKVVILDCCYSGRALLGGMGGTDQVADQALIEGTCLLAASAGTRRALSPPGEKFTAFTGELITALDEGIADGPPLLDMDTLYRHLYTTLAAKARPLPQQRNRNTGGRIALAHNRGHVPCPVPVPAPASAPVPVSVPRPSEPGTPNPPDDSPSGVLPGDAAVEGTLPVPPPRPVAPAAGEPRTQPGRTIPAQQSPTPAGRPGLPPAPVVRPGRFGSARVVFGAATAVCVLAVAIPMALSWREDSPGSSDDGSRTGYNAAITGVVNASDAKGGTLKFVSAQDADSWDPQRGYYGFMWNFSRYYTRQLVTHAPQPSGTGAETPELVPDLATSLAKVSDGGRTYTYTLRAGITWEDGSPVTSKDIKYGIERIWAKETITGGPVHLRSVLDPAGTYEGPYKDTAKDKLGLKSIETPNARTIVFKLPLPHSDFEQMLAMPSASPVKAEKDTGARYGLDPFSSGPYRFQSYAPNKSLVLVRNTHWKKSSDTVRAALPDKITVTFTSTSPGVSLLSDVYDLDLTTVGLDGVNRARALATKDLKKYLDNPRTGFVRYAALPQTVKPLDNIHCRKAVIYAADKQQLQTARGGPSVGDIAPNLLPPGLSGADPTYDPYGTLQNGGKPDVAKAERELRACGKPEGFSTTIVVGNGGAADVGSAESLRDSLAKVGIDAEISQLGKEIYESIGTPNVVKDKGYGVILASWAADFSSGQNFLQPLTDGRWITPSGNLNYAGIDDPAINKLFDDAVAQTDRDKAGEIYRQINRKVSEGAYLLPLLYQKSTLWHSPRLTNVYVSGAYGGYDYASLGVGNT